MSAVCQTYCCEIRAPIAMGLEVEMTAGGLIDHIDGATDEGIPVADDLRVMRALSFLSPMVQALQNRGDLIKDALDQMPEGDDFAVERSILAALAELQQAVTPTFTGRAA